MHGVADPSAPARLCRGPRLRRPRRNRTRPGPRIRWTRRRCCRRPIRSLARARVAKRLPDLKSSTIPRRSPPAANCSSWLSPTTCCPTSSPNSPTAGRYARHDRHARRRRARHCGPRAADQPRRPRPGDPPGHDLRRRCAGHGADAFGVLCHHRRRQIGHTVGASLVYEIGGQPVRSTRPTGPLYHAASPMAPTTLSPHQRRDDRAALGDRARRCRRDRCTAALRAGHVGPAGDRRAGQRLWTRASALTGPVARGDADAVAAHSPRCASGVPAPVDGCDHRRLYLAQARRAAAHAAPARPHWPESSGRRRDRCRHRLSAAPAYVPGELTVHRDPATMSRVSAALRSTGRRVVLVPTMGARCTKAI